MPAITSKKWNKPFRKGCWLVNCDRCGDWIYNIECKKEWTGWIVCYDCYEPRHPLLDEKTPTEDQRVPFVRPDTSENA